MRATWRNIVYVRSLRVAPWDLFVIFCHVSRYPISRWYIGERKSVTFESSRWLNGGPSCILTISSGPRFFDARRLLFQLLSLETGPHRTRIELGEWTFVNARQETALKVKIIEFRFFVSLHFPFFFLSVHRRILFAIRMDTARLLSPRTIGEIQKRLIPDHLEAKVPRGKTRTVYSPLFVHLA